MRTFAELLSHFMSRTGISDSELARTLGVRRQTIFRWKEGLVEKPRYREDVLKVAERLRLAPQERDELLLAAGFPPETPAVLPPPLPSEPASLPAEAVPIPRRVHSRKMWIGVLIAVSGIAAIALLYLLAPRSNLNYPAATGGETLVIIAPQGSPEAETANVPPSRRFPGNGVQGVSDLAEEVRAALEREVQAQRLERVRVAIWPEKIPDATAAEAARARSNARLVIWGNYANGKWVARFSGAPAAARVDDLPLDALVAPPFDLPITVDAGAQEQVQMLALSALGHIYIDRGDQGMARAALTLALARSTDAGKTEAALDAEMGYVAQASKPPELTLAIDYYSQAIDREPNATTVVVNRAVAFIRQNRAEQWQADLGRVLTLAPNQATAYQALCWGYALDNNPQSALPHCDAAVRLDSTRRSRDVRAVVYAEAGRLPEAVADWQVFLAWLGEQPASLRVRYGSTRADWLQAAQAGRNPIDSTTLGRLRQE